jgi:hypothetical protein
MQVRSNIIHVLSHIKIKTSLDEKVVCKCRRVSFADVLLELFVPNLFGR